MQRFLLAVLFFFLPASLFAQKNPQYIYSIDGPCGGTIVGPPGGIYDDRTGGLPYFMDGLLREKVPHVAPGHTWDIVLTTLKHDLILGVHAWQVVVGVEGPLRITDITLDGTAGCAGGRFPECRGMVGMAFVDLTGPDGGSGPQTEDNRGAVCFVLLKMDGLVMLPPEGSEVVCKIRVSARFPEREGDVEVGRVFFGQRIMTTLEGREVQVTSGVYGPERFGPNIGQGGPVTVERGDPPLRVEGCVVRVKASSVAAFLRCDVNEDLKVSVSDAIWILNELFLGGAETRCRPAADCDGDGERSISDAVYALNHLFLGGAEPPRPYPRCDRLDVPVEDCPPGSTACP